MSKIACAAASSYGSFEFDANTGIVLKVDLDEGFGEIPIAVDVVEWTRYYRRTMTEETIDILDLALIYEDGRREEAEPEFRTELKKHMETL